MILKSHHKITLIFGLLGAAIFLGLYFYLNHTLQKFTYHRIDASLAREIAVSRSLLEKSYNPKLTSDQIDAITDQIGKDLGLRVTIIDLNGVVQGDSFLDRPAIQQLENHWDRPEVQESLKKGIGSSHRYSVSLHEDMLYAAVPFGHPMQGILRLAVPLSEVTAISDHLERILWAAIVVSLLLHFFVSFFIADLITKPIERIAKVAQNIAAGDFSKKALIAGSDEIKDLAKAIDFMSQEISGRIAEANAGKSRLEAVFLSMIEGVMVVNSDGKILLINETLKRILHVEHEAIGRKPLEVIRSMEVQDIVNRVVDLHESVNAKELSFFLPEEKILRVHAAPILRDGRTDGVVLVFHDITDLRRLETIRKDFVANVSHELRTPVASIKGYAETLLDGALDDKEHARDFLKIIYSESDRLAKLIDDLLQLARSELGQSVLDLKPCSISRILDWSLAGLGQKIKERDLKVRSDVAVNLPEVKADDSAVAQIFLNLIENAIKYNKPGGEIVISACEKDESVEVCVSDTGLGIPADDLPRIFERFYRVDKSHSRDIPGTGLGLSIVKHIVQAHGGEIKAQSVLGQGTTFCFTIPKA